MKKYVCIKKKWTNIVNIFTLANETFIARSIIAFHESADKIVHLYSVSTLIVMANKVKQLRLEACVIKERHHTTVETDSGGWRYRFRLFRHLQLLGNQSNKRNPLFRITNDPEILEAPKEAQESGRHVQTTTKA